MTNMKEKPFQLVLLPGLGADDRQFQPQQAAFADCLVPPWIPPKRGESLAGYAIRMAQTIEPECPMVLAGSSFGGMVAYEMANHLKPKAVVLIGSCRCRTAIRPVFRALPWLGSLVSPPLLNLAKLISPLVGGWLSGTTGRYRRLCVSMFQQADSTLMSWAVQAILTWEPSPMPDAPVFQIHGRNDRVIPASRVEADELVAGGGHLINLTHAEIVNTFIENAAAAVQSNTSIRNCPPGTKQS